MTTLDLFEKPTKTFDKNSLLKVYEPKSNNLKRPTVVDLFCGCGGLSLGFQRAGYAVIAGVDHDASALTTYQNNLNVPGLDLDLFDDSWVKQIEKELNGNRLDVLVGGPPCQGYSLTGTRKQDDPRNKLYNSVFVGVDYFKPSVVLIENVRGMATLYGGKAKAQVLDEFACRGYNVDFAVLDAADFGVPQHRHRLFFLAVLEKHVKLPRRLIDKNQLVTCEEALSDLAPLDIERGHFDTMHYHSAPSSAYQRLMRLTGRRTVPNHEATRHKQFVIDTIKQVPEGGNHKDLPPGVGESRKFNEAWTRYHSKKPSRTIDTGHRNHFHYKYHRVPTVRENARLQSFPDDFQVFGTRTSQNRQIGNAVPVLLSQGIAMNIFENYFHE